MNGTAWVRGCVGWLLMGAACLAAETNRDERIASTATNEPPLEQRQAVTHHVVTVGGHAVAYVATAGYLPIRNDAGKAQADIFYVAYVQEGGSNLPARPITFAFNGGPGASSIWLHLGALGPKRVRMESPATYGLIDNDQTWLGFTDLVFVDPIGTGFSRAAEGVEAKRFYEPAKDVEVAGQFIRLYVTKNARWLSPKFVAGESYGSTRAAGLANYLQTAIGLNLDGLVLVSSALSFQAFSCDDENDIAFALALPTYAAAAAYHQHKPAPDLGAVEQWALRDYLTAVARGDSLPGAERQRIVEQMARFTGLSTNYIGTSNLRVSPARFVKELLRGEARIVGLMDARVLGVDVSSRGEYANFDPAFFQTTGPFVATLNDYLRRDLNFETNLPYEFLSREVNGSWKWVENGQGYVSVLDDLAAAMARDEHLRVFAAAGMYDLTTPYFGQRFALEHLGLDPSRRTNLVFQVYPAGHQIYTDGTALRKLTADVAAFIARSQGGGAANEAGRAAPQAP